jgi:hypothetical protein
MPTRPRAATRKHGSSMITELVKTSTAGITGGNGWPIIPAIIADAGEGAAKRFIGFFTAIIPNAHTRPAYAKAVADFLAWCRQLSAAGRTQKLTDRPMDPNAPCGRSNAGQR